MGEPLSLVVERPRHRQTIMGNAASSRRRVERVAHDRLGDAPHVQEASMVAKTAKNRMQLDLIDSDSAGVDRLAALGASIVGRHSIGRHGWPVMHDPEGNEFCVAEGLRPIAHT
jgi:hypothetical protein